MHLAGWKCQSGSDQYLRQTGLQPGASPSFDMNVSENFGITRTHFRVCGTRALLNPPFRLCEISFVNFKPDKFFHATALRGDGGIPNAEKRIKHRANA
jgi:hypothetical protein